MTSSFQNRVSKRVKFAYYEQLFVKIVKSGKIRNIPSKVDIDLVVILLPQIIVYISAWFHFNITLIFLSPFAQDIIRPNCFSNNDVRSRIESLKFVKPVLRSQDICLKISLKRFFLSFYGHLYVMCQLKPFLTKSGVNDVTTRKYGMRRHQDFVMFQN